MLLLLDLRDPLGPRETPVLPGDLLVLREVLGRPAPLERWDRLVLRGLLVRLGLLDPLDPPGLLEQPGLPGQPEEQDRREPQERQERQVPRVPQETQERQDRQVLASPSQVR